MSLWKFLLNIKHIQTADDTSETRLPSQTLPVCGATTNGPDGFETLVCSRQLHCLVHFKSRVTGILIISSEPLLPPQLVCLCPVSEDVCKRGFTVIIDMRGSKWELIKPLLKTLQESFPAEICVALIIKPDNFWQKQKTNFGSAKFSFEVSGLCVFYPTRLWSFKGNLINSKMIRD